MWKETKEPINRIQDRLDQLEACSDAGDVQGWLRNYRCLGKILSQAQLSDSELGRVREKIFLSEKRLVLTSGKRGGREIPKSPWNRSFQHEVTDPVEKAQLLLAKAQRLSEKKKQLNALPQGKK